MQDAPDAHTRRSGVQSIEVGGALLEAMIALGGPAPLSEIAKAAGMPPAKAHRYLISLGEIGLTLQDKASGRYSLGPLALRLGLASIAQNDMIERAYEVLVELCLEVGTSGHLSVWSDAGPVVIRSTHGAAPVISPVSVGTILPLLGSASGAIYLSWMPEVATAEVFTRQAIGGTLDRARLAEIRKTSYAFADGQYIPGLHAMAMPVMNHDDVLAGVVTLVSTRPDFFHPDGDVFARALDAMQTLRREWSAQS